MGIVDTIKGFFEKKEAGKLADDKLKAVQAAVQESNYNEASIRAFIALEEFGKVFKGIERESNVTAREYSKLLIETGSITSAELEPIIHNFEIATYSPYEVSFDDYRQIEESLDTAKVKLKQTAPAKGSRGGKRKKARSGGKRKRARSGKAGGSAAARKRKARKRTK